MLYRAGALHLRAIIADYQLRRVQTQMVTDDPVSRRWAERLGFHFEALLRRFSPDGEDMVPLVLFPEGRVIVRPIRPGEEVAAQALVARCHPGWPARPLIWFFAHPTLVALDDDDTMIGCTAFAIDQTNTIMHLRDTVVAPEVRGRGVARALMAARLGIGEVLAITTFIGATWESNAAMRRLLDSFGFHACQRLTGYFAHNDPPADVWHLVAHTAQHPGLLLVAVFAAPPDPRSPRLGLPTATIQESGDSAIAGKPTRRSRKPSHCRSDPLVRPHHRPASQGVRTEDPPFLVGSRCPVCHERPLRGRQTVCSGRLPDEAVARPKSGSTASLRQPG